MRHPSRLAPLLLFAAALPACHAPGTDVQVKETGFPGQFSAGGDTSGEVMARARDVPAVEGAAGTPGIPEGSGGNTSGAAMGGNTSGAAMGGTTSGSALAATGTATSPTTSPAAAGASAAQSEAERKATEAARGDREKQQLAAAMDRIAQRWRQSEAAEGSKTSRPTPVDAMQGYEQSERQSSPAGQPDGKLSPRAAEHPIRSEKHGTAPPSEDVKQPRDDPARNKP